MAWFPTHSSTTNDLLQLTHHKMTENHYIEARVYSLALGTIAAAVSIIYHAAAQIKTPLIAAKLAARITIFQMPYVGKKLDAALPSLPEGFEYSAPFVHAYKVFGYALSAFVTPVLGVINPNWNFNAHVFFRLANTPTHAPAPAVSVVNNALTLNNITLTIPPRKDKAPEAQKPAELAVSKKGENDEDGDNGAGVMLSHRPVTESAPEVIITPPSNVTPPQRGLTESIIDREIERIMHEPDLLNRSELYKSVPSVTAAHGLMKGLTKVEEVSEESPMLTESKEGSESSKEAPVLTQSQTLFQKVGTVVNSAMFRLGLGRLKKVEQPAKKENNEHANPQIDKENANREALVIIKQMEAVKDKTDEIQGNNSQSTSITASQAAEWAVTSDLPPPTGPKVVGLTGQAAPGSAVNEEPKADSEPTRPLSGVQKMAAVFGGVVGGTNKGWFNKPSK